MTLFEVFFLFVCLINAALGVSVFLTNNKRVVNQHYLFLSIIIALWLTSNWVILRATTEADAKFFIKLATAVAILIPASCHLLRLAILFPNDSWWKIIIRAKGLLGLCLIITALCFTPFFISSVKIPSEESLLFEVPEPVYNWGYFVFAVVFIALVVSLLLSFAKDRNKATGLQRIELDFVAIGYCVALATGTVCGVVVTVFTGSSQTVPMANASSILALTSIISYGIATRRILGIATILRRITAYSILAIYLVTIYLLVWHATSLAFVKLGTSSPLPSQILATLVVAFTMAPVHGKLQKITEKLIASKTMNIPEVMRRSGDIFQSVTTQNALLIHFSRLLQESLSAEHATFLLATKTGFSQHYPNPNKKGFIEISHNSALASLLNKNKESVSSDVLVRTRETSIIKTAIRELDSHNAHIAIGVFSKSNLTGIVLLGARIDGRIYDKNEQDALQLLCNQFAVALENAQMYTEVQDSKIRNDIMLDQLTSGVIVANTDRKITLVNHEAQRVVGLTEQEALGQGIELLPDPISKALETTLAIQNGLQNSDAVLFGDEEESKVHVRMGSAYLMGHDQKPMGALLVFTDMTEVKLLEEQVRRADQLSSVGTLAAGMAHEIKNPLVTIKTFTQLLPERHEDDDFRKEFSTLVAHEVSRIDGIVNQLLRFSKPSHPNLVPMRLHETVEKTLKLIHEQLSQKNISLTNNLLAKHDLVSGDADLLTQTLVNFNLNAIEAIESDGEITVSTTNCTYRFVQGGDPGNAIKKPCIRLQISDTGEGIEKDLLQKIFDPFFTSKSQGTGMGLSVSHGIIREHNGAIEVESKRGAGTTFSIYIPTIEEDSAA